MTDRSGIADSRECGGEVAAYALGALDAAEAHAFSRHLETCVVCRDELLAFQQVVDVLPMSAPTYAAPAGLRRRVLRAIDKEPTLGDATEAGRARRPARRLGFAMPRPVLAFGAAATLAVAAVVVVLTNGSSPPAGPRVIAAQVTGQGSASLQLSHGRAELVVHRFSAPPAGQIYEVWLQRGKSSPSPTIVPTLFGVSGRGDADVDVSDSLRGVSQVLVTREPAGGSPRPTHRPVIRAALT